MGAVQVQLTVYFDDPFWVGVFERGTDGAIQAARIVFGSEPKDYDVYRKVLDDYFSLSYSAPVRGETGIRPAAANPKRMHRAALRAVQSGVGTKAQCALKLQHEQNKLHRKATGKAARAAEEEKQFLLRTEKRREKHRGH